MFLFEQKCFVIDAMRYTLIFKMHCIVYQYKSEKGKFSTPVFIKCILVLEIPDVLENSLDTVFKRIS